MTKLALIPPLCMAAQFVRHGNTCLLLPQLMRDDRYMMFIQEANVVGAYTILDNGAFENQSATTAELMDMCKKFRVHELVIPDTLGDAADTLSKLRQFDRETETTRSDGPGCYMVVAQGKSISTCFEMIHEAVESHPFVTAIGLPKHLLSTVNENARVVLCNRIRGLYGDKYAIHFLGSSPLWPDEIRYAQGVRSMDTSMPFVFAWHGKRVDIADGPQWERPDRYFSRPDTEFGTDLLLHNINKMREWCSE